MDKTDKNKKDKQLKQNLPKSLRAIISNWSSFRPRLVAKRNCQLNISPNCDHVAAGQLAKNMTSWKKQMHVNKYAHLISNAVQ